MTWHLQPYLYCFCLSLLTGKLQNNLNLQSWGAHVPCSSLLRMGLVTICRGQQYVRVTRAC